MNKEKYEKKLVIKEQKTEKKRVPVDPNRWPGVYKYELDQRYQGRSDIAYTITFKDPITRRKIWEKIGTKSQGITPQLCAEIRAERAKSARHGQKVKTSKEIRREQIKHNRPLGEIANAYFKAKGSELKGITTDRNRWDNHLKPIFGNRCASELSEMDVQRLKTAMKGKASGTIWNALELLRRLCNWGSRNKLASSLSFKIKMPKRDNEIVEHLDKEQARRLDKVLKDWKNRDAVRMIKVAMFSGMRRGEIFKLKDTDIDWQHSLINIRTPKGGKSARIPLSDPVAVLLREQIEHRNKIYSESPYIFPGKKGRMRVDCSAAKRIKAEAKLPKSFRIFHGLRHHFAVTLANSGKVDLSLIGELLTHKSHAMTKRYAAFLPETTKAAAELAVELIVAENDSEKVISIEEGRK